MLQIQTQRVRLVALSLAQLKLLLLDREQLERVLSLPVSAGLPPEPARRAIEIKISRMVLIPEEDHPWYTYWLIVIAGQSLGAGLIGFKGAPDERGEVEIGYGIEPAYTGKGYVTEAVMACITWAFRQPGCKSVIAETQKDNMGSIRVLEKAGLQKVQDTGSMLIWRITNMGGHNG